MNIFECDIRISIMIKFMEDIEKRMMVAFERREMTEKKNKILEIAWMKRIDLGRKKIAR